MFSFTAIKAAWKGASWLIPWVIWGAFVLAAFAGGYVYRNDEVAKLNQQLGELSTSNIQLRLDLDTQTHSIDDLSDKSAALQTKTNKALGEAKKQTVLKEVELKSLVAIIESEKKLSASDGMDVLCAQIKCTNR